MPCTSRPQLNLMAEAVVDWEDQRPSIEVMSLSAIGAASTPLLAFSVVVLGAVLKSPAETGRHRLRSAYRDNRVRSAGYQAGLVQVQGELWRAAAGDAEIPAGHCIVIESMEGLRLRVRTLRREPKTQVETERAASIRPADAELSRAR
jgi:membrane-bound ClpP family serine protease